MAPVQTLHHQPHEMPNGNFLALTANALEEARRDAEAARLHGAAGIGLLRSEFMFMNRDDLPGEDEQYENLARVVATLEGRPATIRTLDAGECRDLVRRSLGLRNHMEILARSRQMARSYYAELLE